MLFSNGLRLSVLLEYCALSSAYSRPRARQANHMHIFGPVIFTELIMITNLYLKNDLTADVW